MLFVWLVVVPTAFYHPLLLALWLIAPIMLLEIWVERKSRRWAGRNRDLREVYRLHD